MHRYTLNYRLLGSARINWILQSGVGGEKKSRTPLATTSLPNHHFRAAMVSPIAASGSANPTCLTNRPMPRARRCRYLREVGANLPDGFGTARLQQVLAYSPEKRRINKPRRRRSVTPSPGLSPRKTAASWIRRSRDRISSRLSRINRCVCQCGSLREMQWFVSMR